ncbi:MAG: NAD(+)/NADH kinase [Ilumatobacter sp.]
MPPTIGLIAAHSKPQAAELLDEVRPYLEQAGCLLIGEAELADTDLTGLDAIVVLGGDGLMMRAANSFPDVPLLGINFGKVGFLAMVEQRDWRPALDAMLSGDYRVDNGSTLSAVVERDGTSIELGWALNDVVVRGGVRMVEIEVYIDGQYVNTYPGDGMIVATPRGSTAYGMAAGGPILTAGVRGFAVVPISCHSPIRTPFVVAEASTTQLLIASKHDASLILDGRPTEDLRERDVVKVTRGSHEFRMVTLASMNFYEAFRSKFNFRIRPDAVPTLNDPPIVIARETSAV